MPAWRTVSGSVVMLERGDVRSTMSLACGRCIGCRLERSREWSVRVMHEASLFEENCFVTLTYDYEHLPSSGSIIYSDFQKFIKRLRRRFCFLDRRCAGPKRVIRFFVCGEYGEISQRPHFHVCLFGIDFSLDRKLWRKSQSGFSVYRSGVLERLWSFGASEIGELSSQSAAYVARYSLKKVTGDAAAEHYKSVDSNSGEVTWREPECLHMSLKPGIGALWFERFHTDVYPHDRVVVRGVRSKPPRYYDRLLKRRDPVLLEELQESREREARLRWPDNTPERLVAREVVQRARVSSLKRKLK